MRFCGIVAWFVVGVVGCGAASPSGKKRRDDPPLTIGEAWPTRVAAVGDRWAALRQAARPEELDRAPLQIVWARKRRPIPPVVVDDVVGSAPDGPPLAVIGDRLYKVERDRKVLLGMATFDGRPRPILHVGDLLVVGFGPSLTLLDDDATEPRTVALPAIPTGLAVIGSESWGRSLAITMPAPHGTVLMREDGTLGAPDTADQFATTHGTLRVSRGGGLRVDNDELPPACQAILAVSDDPFRVAARCEDGTLKLRGERWSGEDVDLEEYFEEAPVEGGPFAQTVRTDRLWCDDECIDLVTGRVFPERPLWSNRHYALTREDRILVAHELDYGYRWSVDGAPSLRDEDEEEPPLIAGEGAYVAIGNQVIDVSEHRVVLEGPWVIHAVGVGGSALVTDLVEGADYTIGPVREIAPPEPR